MMPHERCQQSGCWFRQFCAFNPPPKFVLGQRVKATWTGEDGQIFTDTGVVIGLTIDPEWWQWTGWIYWVRWLDLPSSPFLSAPHVEEAHETDLEAVQGESL